MLELPFENIERKILSKKECIIGKTRNKPKNIAIEELINYGVVNIDKPKGPTKSFTSEVPIRFQITFRKS